MCLWYPHDGYRVGLTLRKDAVFASRHPSHPGLDQPKSLGLGSSVVCCEPPRLAPRFDANP